MLLNPSDDLSMEFQTVPNALEDIKIDPLQTPDFMTQNSFDDLFYSMELESKFNIFQAPTPPASSPGSLFSPQSSLEDYAQSTSDPTLYQRSSCAIPRKSSETDSELSIKMEPASPVCMGRSFSESETDSSPPNSAIFSDFDTSFEIYRELILQHLVQDINNTCSKLGISPDPQKWCRDQTLVWLQEMAAQFHLGEVPLTQMYLPGSVLVAMSLDDFNSAAPQSGETLHAQLQIWKTGPCETDSPQSTCQLSAAEYRNAVGNQETANQQSTTATATAGDWLSTFDPDSFLPPASSLSVQTNPRNGLSLPLAPHQLLHSPVESDSGLSADLEESPREPERTFTHTAGSIHLWQFIRELLDQSERFGQCVRWIDRSEGIFKIEDSHRLARLWGQRKNRHKMNYDKLSRSLRQYYKKNIIRKTGQRQRLIYQFIPPYHLL